MFRQLRIVLEMVKIEHTIFALPFAFMSALLARRGWPSLAEIGWILLAMVGARSAAMAFNRLVDLPFDANNPRTQGRALPRKLITKGFVVVFIVVSAAALVFAASRLNGLALALSPLALAVVFFYSFTKRFTWLSHIFLGVALAAAPIGAWIALRGDIAVSPLVLGLVVVLWVSGFDIIYSCQDVEFDRKTTLHSIPQRFGTAAALWISAFLHLSMLGILAFLFWKEDLGTISYLGLSVVGLLLAYEHSLVRPGDLSRANTAFFTVNGWISVLLFMTTMIDLLWSGPG
ncbi:MAG: putative 4-hydroxybenzoate polyprenyltransferase [Acidobacteriota bacterium]|jgi:4-hydroxybenzoate polyprenyltransferase|nr:putative 4-hydroxybenzoate polyprenyltransferase [Acidobacteriota bacterium]